MTVAPGTRIGAYDVIAAIGAGGMGEVYRARDTRLQREVALKVLPASLAADPVHVERFRREARAVAALSHPNIVTIHSVEDASGMHFLTMELIEGRPLDYELPVNGHPLPALLEIGVPLADALAAAHERGIVHRDLKPANVMLDRHGRVKILDFGLAKNTGAEVLAQAETLAPLTQSGLVIGTMPYMAPEQIEGRAVDARTDLFALGIVLYELATGERPFAGEAPATLMTAILRDQPRPIADSRPDLPGPFGRLVSRCLEKRPNDRIQTARDVHNELRSLQRDSAIAAPSPAAPRREEAVRRDPGSDAGRSGLWMAVLPFTSRGGDEDSTALAEGLTDEIASGLARFPYLKVAATPQRARYVVEGSVRRLGSTIRVAVDLKDVQSGVQIWGEKYDRAVAESNLFVLQDEIAARVIATVGDSNGVVVLSMVGGLRNLPLHELSIDELVLRAVPFAYQQRPEENTALIEALESALSREPSHAEGWACLASLYRAAQLHVGTGIEDAVNRQRQAAQRAVDLDPGCQGGWESLASAAFFVHDAAAFRAAAERAVAINPLNGNVAAFMSHLIAYSGDWSRGLDILDRTLALGTKHPGWYHFMPFVNHYRLGDLEQAWQAVKRVNMPEYPWTLLSLAVTAVELGHWDEARAAIAAVRKHVPKFLDAEVVRAEWGRMVWDEALVARFVSSYRKALDHEAGRRDVQTSERQTSGQRPALSSIAVLPFVNLSADPENEYFGDGLAEEILNALTNVNGLTVIARTSAFAFKGQTGDVRKIGEALGVTTVLEGSVRRSASRVRVSAQLVDVRTGGHLWSQRYDREMTDIFSVQDDIAQAIAVALRGTLAPAAHGRRYTPGVPAYEAFLKGRAQLIRFTPDSWERARTYFEDAIALDPDYPEVHAELALGYFICGMHGMARMRDVAPLVRAGATRALELDPSNEQPRFLLGGLAIAHDYDWEAGRAHFAASIQGPSVPAHARWIYASLHLFPLGRNEESCAEMQRAVGQDPLNATWHGILASHLAHAGRKDEARAAAIRAREIEPNYYVSHHIVGETLWIAGRHAEAIESFQQSHTLAPWFALNAGCLAAALREAGRDTEADRVLADMGPTPRPMFGRVLYDIRVGALDAAAESFERMIGERDPFAVVFVNTRHTIALRAHARWPALAAMMNLPTERR